jgi:hypothetical protein
MRWQLPAANERSAHPASAPRSKALTSSRARKGRGGRHVVEEYARLAGDDASLVKFIRSAPDFDLLDLERSAPRTSRRSRPVVITAAAS